MNNNTKVILGALAGFIIGGMTVTVANQAIQAIQNTEVKIKAFGEIQTFKDEKTNEIEYPITFKDRTYLPLRSIAKIFDVDIDYDFEKNTIDLVHLGGSWEYVAEKLNHEYVKTIEFVLGDDGQTYYVIRGLETSDSYHIMDRYGKLIYSTEYKAQITTKDYKIESLGEYDVKSDDYSEENCEYYKAYYNLIIKDGVVEKELIRIDKNDKYVRP